MECGIPDQIGVELPRLERGVEGIVEEKEIVGREHVDHVWAGRTGTRRGRVSPVRDKTYAVGLVKWTELQLGSLLRTLEHHALAIQQ